MFTLQAINIDLWCFQTNVFKAMRSCSTALMKLLPYNYIYSSINWTLTWYWSGLDRHARELSLNWLTYNHGTTILIHDTNTSYILIVRFRTYMLCRRPFITMKGILSSVTHIVACCYLISLCYSLLIITSTPNKSRLHSLWFFLY